VVSLKGEVEIKVISKDGKIKQQIKSNAIYSDFAQALISDIVNGGTIPKYDQIELWFSTPPQAGITNKSYTASVSTNNTGSQWQAIYTMSDSSSDSYVVSVLYIKSSTGTPTYLAKVAQTISKGSTDVLNITWTISQPYG
jgi:hypothetical protein